MPELPEVETIRRDMARMIAGLKIRKITVLDPRVIRMSSGDFVRRVKGRRILAVKRRGKALLIDLAGEWLVVQPMMTGQLIASSGKKTLPVKDTRVIFDLSKGVRLFYNDQRLFGRVMVVRDLDQVSHVRQMGPEPLERGFTVDGFFQTLQGRRVAIKTLLLNHRIVAGIGNIYASESLFLAGIRPDKKAAGLSRNEVKKLHAAIRQVLREAVRLRGTSMRNYRDGQGEEGKYLKIIKVYGRDGKPCRQCGRLIRRIVQSQRSTFYCPGCQL